MVLQGNAEAVCIMVSVRNDMSVAMTNANIPVVIAIRRIPFITVFFIFPGTAINQANLPMSVILVTDIGLANWIAIIIPLQKLRLNMKRPYHSLEKVLT